MPSQLVIMGGLEWELLGSGSDADGVFTPSSTIGADVGDYVVVAAAVGGETNPTLGTDAASKGWTALETVGLSFGFNSGGLVLWFKKIDGTETTSTTFINQSGSSEGALWGRFRGPIPSMATASFQSRSSDGNPFSISTTPPDKSLLVAAFSGHGSTGSFSRTFPATPLLESTMTGSNFRLYLMVKGYVLSPGAVSTDMGDAANVNLHMGGYLAA